MNVIVVFPKLDSANNIKRILQQSGFEVNAVCTTGAQALQHANSLDGGIIITSPRLIDMMYSELHEYLPPFFEMLLIAPPSGESREVHDLVCLNTPLKVHELVQTMNMMAYSYSRKKKKRKLQPKERSAEEKTLLNEAKGVLMERNNMTEEEAHRYIQKRSMDNGTDLVETAQMIISLLNS